MAQITSSNDIQVLKIRQFLGLNENPDGDTKIKNGEMSKMRNFRITREKHLQLRPGTKTVLNLKTAWEKKIPAYIVDSRNLITIPVETSFEIRKEEQFGKYVSFFPLEKEVTSITLEGFAYPLDHHYLPNSSGGLCVSNEIVEETAHVSYEGGILLMVQSRD